MIISEILSGIPIVIVIPAVLLYLSVIFLVYRYEMLIERVFQEWVVGAVPRVRAFVGAQLDRVGGGGFDGLCILLFVLFSTGVIWLAFCFSPKILIAWPLGFVLLFLPFARFGKGFRFTYSKIFR